MRLYKIILESLDKPAYLGKGFPSNRDLKEKWYSFDPESAREKFPKKKPLDLYSDKEKKDLKDDPEKKGFIRKRIDKINVLKDASIKPFSSVVQDKKEKLKSLKGNVSNTLKSRSLSDLFSNSAELAKNVVDVIY